MIVRPSALKHVISEADGVEAATWPVLVMRLDDENPQRVLRLGFDSSGRLLEVVVLLWDDGTEELIHCMRARKKYLRLL
ncbi:hypothetical protein BJF89_08130 [Corynebacterium sp. CNJ-954]|nr:hypothetical protein [Corynebacterium sp. CNJ-954]OLT51088.1 hypothetical protein BJF89_08130 [Corynebacterium sp. CNJ-954]